MMKNKKGFSLIELIVVMTIIVVISTIAMISYGTTNKKARDAKRASDLQKIAIAMEMARQIGSTYPASSATLINNGYLQTWPKDPKNYTYLFASTDYTYSVSAYMEDLGSTNIPASGSCGAPGNCNYKITNP